MIADRRLFARLQTGMSLIEIIVSLSILSFSLLGIAALQTRGTQWTTAAYHRSQAVFLAYDLVDRMRANPAGATTYASRVPLQTYNANCLTAPCSGEELAQFDVTRWNEDIARILPSGTGTVSAQGRDVIIQVKWHDNLALDAEYPFTELKITVRI